MVGFNTGESETVPTFESLGFTSDVAGGLGEVGICAKLEEDLAMMGAEESEEFREAMGLEEPAVERVKQVATPRWAWFRFLLLEKMRFGLASSYRH
ncbi:MAG: hypothetical protein Ct9H300mP11_08630 [Chloroflexota bacterium]|nr:MAG: hypothetical protein Ct9H300mP11_08630 [Chloroflexota bacterium]